jgi:tetratricopeptide (TPR) repeat protein
MDSPEQKRLNFRFSIPQQPAGPWIEVSAQEAEKILLKRLEEQRDNPADAMWQVARFYSQCNQHEKALDYLRQVLAVHPDLESKANCVLGMGQTMEQVGDYVAAVRYYREALALEPVRTATWYFINNNLGFSLNMLSQFAEGEPFCRRAIEVDPNRPNAHKNLGIALAGQGRSREAVRCFVTATQVNAADARSLRLLEDLLRKHPEIQAEFQAELECCRAAVKLVAEETGRGRS